MTYHEFGKENEKVIMLIHPAVVTRLLANGKIYFNHAVIDGGITPYQLPWFVTRIIALRDFAMISMGKIGGIKLLEKAFSILTN